MHIKCNIQISTLNIIESDKFLKRQTLFPQRIHLHLAEAETIESPHW